MAEREGAPTQSPRPTEWKEAEKVYDEQDKREREPRRREPER
jgi:hypothetical protein